MGTLSPESIGMSIVRLIKVDGTTLVIEDVDILDGTPLLDLKPYMLTLDSYPDSSSGWQEHVQDAESVRSDSRFR